MKGYAKFALIIIFLFFSFWEISIAQAPIREAEIAVTISPESPGPRTDAAITLSSFAADLDKADISWSLNGQLALQGTGKKKFLFTTGDGGTQSVIDISISFPGSPIIAKRVTVSPGEVDLLWQAIDSYVPRFYRGKALPTIESQIRVVAIPSIRSKDGIRLKENEFAYKWKRNFDTMTDASGFGKNSFTYKNNYLDTIDNISVSLSSRDGLYNANTKVSITPGQPKIVFYRANPLLGTLYNEALTESYTVRDAISLVTEPYFFSHRDVNFSDLNFKWLLNNQDIGSSGRKNELALRKQEGQSGTARLDITVTNPIRTFQRGNNNLQLSF